ncbi:MAG: choice-of-anchor J domain-containing protein [Candidatus Cloacimonadaceae bacterium]|nr:choice-of-anchor J domain-containing protein [Candidatus Cloacimonadaceae bacterium]
MKKTLFILAMMMLFCTIFATTREIVTVGEGNMNLRIPIDVYWKNSLYQTIYYANEMGGATGSITALEFYNSFYSPTMTKPIKIWLGTTTLPNLQGGWITADQLSMVFDGEVLLPNGQNTITINLETPFVYTGGNLVMMIKRVLDEDFYSSSDYFRSQSVGANRALKIVSDSVDYDPYNPVGTPTMSAEFPKTSFHFSSAENGTLSGTVTNPQGEALEAATITIVQTQATTTTNAEGFYSMQLAAGTYTVRVSKTGYQVVIESGVQIVAEQTTTLDFELPLPGVVFSDGFEEYPNFSLTFAPWTLVDVDQSDTYGITGNTWQNIYLPMAYIIFNPSATTPPVTTGAESHSGSKYAASFASTSAANNDWMITPAFMGGGEVSFWARSYVSTYGLERFRVGVSTTDTTPSSFTIISGQNYIQTPVAWTQYTYSLAPYQGQQIRIGIQCVSDDAFIFMVDDVSITGTVSNPSNAVPAPGFELLANYPNPFNPSTTIRYGLKHTSPVSIEVYNLKGQKVSTLVNETKPAGDHAVTWNGTDMSGRAVSSGVYYYKMQAGKFSSTRKMILMK